MKAAIIGCGVISDVYINNLINRFHKVVVAACSDIDINRAQATAQKYGIKAMSYEDILNDSDIELIINLTNPGAHFSIIKEALQHGKHVFTEKPLSVSLEDGIELCNLARKHNVRLGCAPDTFLGAGLQTGKYVIEKGLIGKPLSFVASISRDFGLFGERLPHLTKKGGGILFDMGPYYLTALINVFGAVRSLFAYTATNNPHRVNARLSSPNYGKEYNIEVENVAAITLEFCSGVIGVFHLTSDALFDEVVRLEVYGTEGIVSLGDPNTFGHAVTLKRMLGEDIVFPFTHGFSGQARGVGVTEMAWAIEKERPHRASMEMACHVLEICSGVLESAQTGLKYEMKTTCTKPEALPHGFIECGDWGPTEESALA